MLVQQLLALAAFLLPVYGLAAPKSPFHTKRDVALLKDIHQISTYWADRKPYNDTPPSYFGVTNTGLPYGCGYEQVHHLIRHASKYPSGTQDDPDQDINFGNLVAAIQAAEGPNAFFGPLEFLNRWKYVLGASGLVAKGFAEEVAAGVDFWNKRGRLLYNATFGEPFYNALFPNGTARPAPLLRTTSEQRVLDSANAWATGFFAGPGNLTEKYRLLVLYEGGTENNTLASYGMFCPPVSPTRGADAHLPDGCANDNVDIIGDQGSDLGVPYIDKTGFLNAATNRLNGYLVNGNLSFAPIDVYAMMDLCGFEYAALGSSDFCGLFTEEEWQGFEHITDLEFYYDDSYGNAVGRAQGIGYLQELLARIQKQYITVSETSVNTTYTTTAEWFPLDQRFYADFTHDDILWSQAISWSFWQGNLPKFAFPPDLDHKFDSSSLVPFATRLNTEIIGCTSANPEEVQTEYTIYYPESNGYDPANAKHKFIRQTWNGAIVPLATIRDGPCASRTDGLCELDAFVDYQNKFAAERANYQFACFSNYTDVDGNGDGTVFA